jgi:hypothetical protein
MKTRRRRSALFGLRDMAQPGAPDQPERSFSEHRQAVAKNAPPLGGSNAIAFEIAVSENKPHLSTPSIVGIDEIRKKLKLVNCLSITCTSLLGSLSLAFTNSSFRVSGKLPNISRRFSKRYCSEGKRVKTSPFMDCSIM